MLSNERCREIRSFPVPGWPYGQPVNHGNTIFSSLGCDLRKVVYSCLCDSLDENWVKTGTLGARVTTKICDGHTYNKPAIAYVLQHMFRELKPDVWPGPEIDNAVGARVALSCRQTFRDSMSVSPASPEEISSFLQSGTQCARVNVVSGVQEVHKTCRQSIGDDATRPNSQAVLELPLQPGHTPALSTASFVRYGPVWASDDKSFMTVPLKQTCSHVSVCWDLSGLRPFCKECGLWFTFPKSTDDLPLFFNPFHEK